MPVESDTPKGNTFEDIALKAIDINSLNIISHEGDPPQDYKAVSQTSLLDTVKPKSDIELTTPVQPTSSLGIANYMLIPYSRTPMVQVKHLKCSTFTPTAFNYYEVVHYMDSLISTNLYFERTGFVWHPFLSRLYFGFLLYLQTGRAMLHANYGTENKKLAISNILSTYTPERLPVPGPLIPMLQTLAATNTEYEGFGMITPNIPTICGPTRGTLHPQLNTMLGLPNLPVINGFLRTITDAPDNDIPDYTLQNTFTNAEAHVINGINIPRPWNQHTRDILLQPGMTHYPETTREIDQNVFDNRDELNLLTIDANSDVSNHLSYFLATNLMWLEYLLPTMATYCSFFKESGNLGHCSASGPNCSLLRSRLTTLTSQNAATNISYLLTSAFPEQYPYRLIYDTRSYETTIAQPYMAMAQYAAINTMCDYHGMGNWSHINRINHGRYGSYWTIDPSRLHQTADPAFADVENIISSQYYIDNPSI